MFKSCLLIFCCGLLVACASSTTKQNNNLAEIDANLALIDLNHAEPLAAKSRLLAALQLAPEDAQVLAAWGYYWVQMGDEVSAEQAYQQALHLAPQDPQIQDDYAVFLYQQKNYVGALHYFLLAASNSDYLYAGLAYQNASLAAAHLQELQASQNYEAEALKMMPQLAGH